MIKDVDYYTNGIATILQSPEHAKIHVKATNVGTVVEQEANTDAWFHIPLTTHIQIADIINNQQVISRTHVNCLFLNAKVNENAKIDSLHLRDGTKLIVNRNVNFIDRNISESLYMTTTEQGQQLYEGLALSIHVRFLTGVPRGRVEFKSAGVRLRITGP